MSSGDEEGYPGAVYFGANGHPMTAAQVQEEMDRAAASTEAFWADLRRILFQELDADQLNTLKHLFRQLAESEPIRSTQLANYYEGLVSGAEAARQMAEPLFFGGDDDEEEDAEQGTLFSHPFVLQLEKAECDTCGLPYNAVPHQRWEQGIRGDGSE